MPLRDLIAPALDSAADRVAVIGGARRLTYHDLDDQARSLAAHWLRCDLRPCDRVALWMRNSPELLVAYLACWKASSHRSAQAGALARLDLPYQVKQGEFVD